MFKSGGYIKIFTAFTFVILLIGITNKLNAQFTCADASFGAGNGQQIRVQGAAGLATFCAPVVVDWYISFDASIPVGADVDVIVDWGDGNAPSTYNTNNFGTTWEISDGNGTTFTVGSQTYTGTTVARKIYPIDEEVCFFDITARLVIDGNVCAASNIINKVNYWDTDEDLPGSVNIDPILIQVCAGDQVTVNFDDNTIFNCIAAADTDNPNEDLRNVRWTYNTTNGAAPFGRIDDILLGNGEILDGSNAGDQDYIPPQADVIGSDVNTIEEYQAIVGPGDAVSNTLDITVPASADIGEVFEIKLENWGPCNPLGGPIPVIERYAIIEIVAPPQGLDFTISENADGSGPRTEFCPGEDIRFRGSVTNTGGNNDYEFDWEIYDGPTDAGGPVGTINNDRLTWLSDAGVDLNTIFTTSGDKLIRMLVQNTDGGLTGNCIVAYDQTIEIIETPTPTIATDDLSGGGPDDSVDEINLCEVDLPVSFNFTDETPDRNGFSESRWTIFDNDNLVEFGGGGFSATGTTLDNPVGLSSFEFTSPGHYKVVLEIRDGTTGCEASDTVNVFIYDTPEANFQANTICAGDIAPDNRTRFFNIANSTNGISPQVNGDEIVSWMWDFSYIAGDGFNVERNVTNNNNFRRFLDGTDGVVEPTESAPGDYTVALMVETDAGCTHLYTTTVTVNHNPESDLEATYTNNYEGNLAGDAYTGDPICPGTLLTFTNITNEALNDASVDPVDYELQIDSLGITIYRPIEAPGETNESVSPNIFFNNTGSNETYNIELVANGDNGCEVISSPITVTVLPGSASGFDIYDEPTYTDAYDPLIDYCSPSEFYFQIDNPTDNLLVADDSLVWEVYDGSTLLGGDTVEFSDPDYDKFSFEFFNDYPSIAAINYTIVLQPYVNGVCVNNSQRTVRVLPKPTSDFMPVDTVVTCDSVTYYFEAEQPGLLTYDWQVQTIADTLSTQNDGVDFWVSYARPDIGDPDVNVEVRLETTNPFGCQSDLSDPFNDIILPKENINVILEEVGTEFCAPTIFGFVNRTTDAVPAGTEWELIIKNVDLNDSTIIDGNTLPGNEDFTNADPGDIFEYEFTDSAEYEIRLNALLPSTCDVASDPPITLEINETPTANFTTNISEGCSPLSVDLLGASTIPSGQDFILSYQVINTVDNSIYHSSASIVGNGGQLNSETVPDLVNTTDPFIDYEITVTAESLAGCTNDSTVTVRVFQEPQIDFDIISPNPACQENYDFEFEIDPSVLNVPAGTEYTWNWGDGSSSLTTDQDTAVNHEFSNRFSFFDDDTYTVTLTAETPNNCLVSVSKVVDLYPRLQAQFNVSNEKGCDPLSVTFTSASLGSDISGGHEYFKRLQGSTTWDLFVETASNSGTVTELFENNTTSTEIWEILYVVEGRGPCADTADIKEIIVNPSPDFEVDVSESPLCQLNENGDYEFEFELSNVIVPNGTEFTWNWGDGSADLTTTSTDNQTHIFQNRLGFFGSDNYTVRVTAETDSSCILNKTVNIQLHPQIEAAYNVNQTEECSPATFIFTSTSRGTNLTGNHQYLKRLQGDTPWLPFNGTISPAGNVTETLTNTTNTNEIWEILYIVESASGCIDSTDIEEITVFSDAEFDVNVVEDPLCQSNPNGDYEFEFSLDNVEVPTGTTFTWNWGDGSSEPATTSSANQTHIFQNRLSFFGTDNYTVSVSAETLDGCILNKTIPIQLYPRIEALFFMDQTAGCSPFEVNLSSSSRGTGLTGNYLYQQRIKGETTWTNIAGGASNGIAANTFTNTGNDDVIYEIRHIITSDVGNCSDTSAIQELTIFPEFSTPNITGPSEVCSFQQEAVYSIPHTMGSTYNWQLPLGAFISSQNANGNQVKINFSSFSGDVQVTEINANGCFGEPSILAVRVLSGPSVSLSLNGPNTICPGDETSLLFNLQGEGSQGFDVIYSDGVENDTLENINDGHIETITPTQSRNYFVLDVIDRQYPNCNAASVSGNAYVNVNFAPTASISGDATICEDGSTNLFINLTGAGPWEVVYTDQSSNYVIENITSPVYQLAVSPEAITTYELVSVTDSNTPVCSGSVEGSATVNINSKPTAVISGNFDNICANESVQLGIELKGFAPWTIRYTDGTNTFTIPNITPPAGHDPENDTYTHNFDVFPNTGTTNYTLVDVRDSNTPNCTGDVSGTAVVTAYDRPQVEIEGNNTICFGESSDITFNFTGDGPFDVMMTGNQDTLEYNNLQNGQSITLTPEVSTVYRVIELIDNRGCSANSLGGPVSININNLPTSEISGNDVTCNGEETELIFDQSGVGPWTITYTNGTQNFTFTTSFNRHFEPVFPTNTTTYTLVSVVDSNSPNSCNGTVSGSALKEVYPELDANFEASPEEMILPESTVTITNNTTNKNEWEYEWTFGDGTTSTEVDPAPHEYGTFGTFVIRMTATNGQCTDTYQTSVTIGAIPPIIDFDANPTEGCLPLVVEFENLTQFADPSTYQWEFGDGQRVSAVENPTHVYRNPGTYTVTLSATNITGQRTEMIKEEFILVNETPVASFTIPDEYRQVFTTEEVRFVNLSEGADEFIWKFGDGNESFEEEPIHAYPDSGIYDITLIAINSETGCTDSMTLSSQVQVILGGTSDTPNAFTPSRAGPGTGSSNPNQNDFFLPKVEGVSQFNMKIYNRWGELLFESNDKNVGWDGYYNSVLMPQGVYVYRLELVYENGRRETKIGDITLIR